MLRSSSPPELVIGLSSPVGTDNNKAYELLESSLKRHQYKTQYFKVTKLMRQIRISGQDLIETPTSLRYDSHIKYANRFRSVFADDGALAVLCCSAIRTYRRRANKTSMPIESQAYIFDQFKRKEEIETLRQIYGRLFVLVSIYSDKEKRLRLLADRFSSSFSRPQSDQENAATDLIKRDEEEGDEQHGQRLRATFPLADVFINIDQPDKAREIIDRFVDALFGSNNISPTRDEYAMYIAKTASLQSLDLSRQVGAALFSDNRDIIAVGCNEVPKAGGGVYWCDDGTDARDYKSGRDENDRIKRTILADVVRRLNKQELIQTKTTEEDLVDFVMRETSTKGSVLREAELMDLLEFGRVIHAEMSAICDAARTGRATKSAVLFCTTFPCHMCAKHIVAAGIKEVYFIEPYPKSYAEQLHRDSINLSVDSLHDGKVKFSPFIGIAPYRYRELFERGRRKNDSGEYIPWIRDVAIPNTNYTIPIYLESERSAVLAFQARAQQLLTDGTVVFDEALEVSSK